MDAWDVLEKLAGSIEGPADWSQNLDHYLYGAPKRTNDVTAPDPCAECLSKVAALETRLATVEANYKAIVDLVMSQQGD